MCTYLTTNKVTSYNDRPIGCVASSGVRAINSDFGMYIILVVVLGSSFILLFATLGLILTIIISVLYLTRFVIRLN